MAGNFEREAFKNKTSAMSRGGEKPAEHEGGGEHTKIMHDHPKPGMHTVHHADGEKTEHPSVGHMLMGLHAKHAEGEGGHMEVHPEGHATTHHVGMDGMVQGPDEHEGPQEAGEHLGSVMSEPDDMSGGGGGGMGNGSGESSGGGVWDGM